MHMITPKTFLIAETRIVRDGMNAMLAALGVDDFQTDAASDTEEVVEVAGRLCYKSFAPGLNANVTRTRRGNRNYIGNILKSGHGSVVQHGSVTFGVLGVTAVLTHELVRHGVGTAFSQQSGRYCRIEDIGFYWPQVFEQMLEGGLITSEGMEQITKEAERMLGRMEDFQHRLAEFFEIDGADMPFDLKKKLQSAFRRWAPYGIETGLVFTANHRALRHIIALRNDVHAEEEIRLFACQVADLVKPRYPALYQDMTEQAVETKVGDATFEESVWKFANHKV